MRWFDNLKLGRKLLLVFALLTALVAVMGGSSLQEIGRMSGATADLSQIRMPGIQVNGELRYLLAARRTLEYMHVLSTDDAEMKAFESQHTNYLKALDTLRKSYSVLLTTERGKAMFAQFEARYAAYDKDVAPVMELSRAHKAAEAAAMMNGKLRNDFLAMSKEFEDLGKLTVEAGKQSAAAAAEVERTARTITILILGVVVALAVGAALMLKSGIATPILAMTDAMRRLAGGDKTIEIPAQGRKDEVGAMSEAVEVFKQNAIEAERLATEQEAARAAQMQRAADDREPDPRLRFPGVAGARRRSPARAPSWTPRRRTSPPPPSRPTARSARWPRRRNRRPRRRADRGDRGGGAFRLDRRDRPPGGYHCQQDLAERRRRGAAHQRRG